MRIKSLAQSYAEKKTYSALVRALSRRGYEVFMNMRLSEVLQRDPEELDIDDDYKFRTMHFDFVVSQGKDFIPKFVVEFDGPHHQQPTSELLDAIKNKFCKDANLSMFRISNQELTEYESVSLLSWIIERWLAWQKEQPIIRHELEEAIKERVSNGETISEIIENDPSALDSTFVFDIRHPYPAILTIAHRLHRLGIKTGHISDKAFSRIRKHKFNKGVLECTVLPGGIGPTENEWAITERTVYVYPYMPGAKCETSFGDNRIYKSTQRVKMRWALPVGWDARRVLGAEHKDWDDPDYLEWFKKRINHLWPCELPGAWHHAIAEGLAEYLVLRDVEDWALGEESLQLG